jgi:hypothetical protein
MSRTLPIRVRAAVSTAYGAEYYGMVQFVNFGTSKRLAEILLYCTAVTAKYSMVHLLSEKVTG